MPIEVKVPSVGESVTEVYVGEWYKAEGDSVDEDENLVELESDKATFDAPAPAAGVLVEILKKSGETAEVGEIIAYIDDSGKPPAKKAKTNDKANKKDQPAKAKGKPAPPADGKETQPRVMPAAERLLKEHDLAANDVEATGPGGRLLKEDVLRFVEQAGSEGADEGRVMGDRKPQSDSARQEDIVPMSPLRRRIAERLVRAKQSAALLTTFNEVDMSAVIDLRKRYQDDFHGKYDVKLGFMSFFVKAVIDALNQFPQLNAEVRENSIVYHNYFDIGIAVGTNRGLVVPIVRDAERLSFAEVEQTINDLAQRARDGKLSVDDFRGGTFTISNGGIYGSLLSTPIVNPPQSGVLGMHSIQDRPVVRDGQIVIRPMMYVALTYDHRIVDGREAVSFLSRVKQTIEEPARMLIEA